MMPQIEIDPEACDGEGLCVRTCPEDIFQQKERGTTPTVVHPEECFFCGQCVAVCPGDAITHGGFDMANFPLYTAELEIQPDTLLGFLRMRRSVRNYNQRRPVPREMVEKLLDAARYAPTGSNAQSLKHIIIESRETMDRLASLCIDLFKERVDLSQDKDAPSSLDPQVREAYSSGKAFLSARDLGS